MSENDRYQPWCHYEVSKFERELCSGIVVPIALDTTKVTISTNELGTPVLYTM